MKVLHIAPTPFFSDRGCHIRIQGIINALQRRSVENVLCTYHHGRDVEGIETVRSARIPGYKKQEAGPSPFKYLADILLFFRICQVMLRYRPDIIHGHLHEGVLLGWAARLLFFWRRTPLVFDMQGSLVGELEAHGHFGGSGVRKRLFRAIEKLITRMPDYTLCSSPQSVSILLSVFGVPADRVALASDGVDITAVDEQQRSELRQQLGIPEGRPVIVYSGALLAAKGLDALKQVVRETARRFPDVHFLLVGYPTDDMQSFLDGHGLQASCTLAGRVPFERLSAYLSLADAAMEPKAADSGEASGKLLNYMGAGLPVICFETPNNRDMLGDSGYFAPQGTAAGLAEQVGSVVADPEQAAQRGETGRVRVRERYSWDATAAGVLEIYDKALAA